MALFLVASLLSACPKEKIGATADCKTLERYQSSFGILNTPQFGVGAVVDIDLAAKRGARLVTVNVPNTDQTETPPVDHSEIISNANFEISTSVEIPVAVKGQIETAVNNNTTFFLRNHRRKDIRNPLATLMADKSATEQVRAKLSSGSGHALMYVTGVVPADELKFKLRNAVGTDIEAKTIEVGDYEVTMNYACEGSLSQAARQAGLFFKVGQLKMAGADVTLVPIEFDIRTISLDEAISLAR